MTATYTVRCPNGCFTVQYEGTHDSVPDSRFVADLGVPTGIVRNGNRCPRCGDDIDVSGGDD